MGQPSTPPPVRRVAVIGAGTIGASWTAWFLSRGLEVVASDPSPAAPDLVRRMVEGAWPILQNLGAAPGGWTWALARLGAGVAAVDKAPLDPAVAALPNVSVRRESAFGLDPRREAPVDWLFSDVVCYPERLLGLVRRWLDAGRARHVVCTVKFQGDTDHATAAAFAAIPGATLFHGAHNRHELTFCRLGPGAAA